MDKELKDGILDIAQAQRLTDEEEMHAENIAGTIKVNEDIEDKNDFILQLRKKYKFWRGTYITGLIVLLIILLYILFSPFFVSSQKGFRHKPSKPTPSVTDETPEPDKVTEQKTVRVIFDIKQEPTTELVGLKKTPIRDLVSGVEEAEVVLGGGVYNLYTTSAGRHWQDAQTEDQTFADFVDNINIVLLTDYEAALTQTPVQYSLGNFDDMTNPDDFNFGQGGLGNCHIDGVITHFYCDGWSDMNKDLYASYTAGEGMHITVGSSEELSEDTIKSMVIQAFTNNTKVKGSSGVSSNGDEAIQPLTQTSFSDFKRDCNFEGAINEVVNNFDCTVNPEPNEKGIYVASDGTAPKYVYDIFVSVYCIGYNYQNLLQHYRWF